MSGNAGQCTQALKLLVWRTSGTGTQTSHLSMSGNPAMLVFRGIVRAGEHTAMDSPNRTWQYRDQIMRLTHPHLAGGQILTGRTKFEPGRALVPLGVWGPIDGGRGSPCGPRGLWRYKARGSRVLTPHQDSSLASLNMKLMSSHPGPQQ